MAPGATWTNVSKVLGRETDAAVRAGDPRGRPRRARGHNKTADSRDDIGVTAVDAGRSRIRYEATITFKGLARFADPLMDLVFRGIADETVDDMTAALSRVGSGA